MLRDVPADFATFRPSPASRSAPEILSHMVDLMGWAERLARGEYSWEARRRTRTGPPPARAASSPGWPALTPRWRMPSLAPYPAGAIFQGPIADALTHTGQLALMRGLAGHPVRPESYARAAIEAGRVGPEQAAPGREFDGDASRPA